MKLDLAIEELHRSENHLVTVLMSMSDKHKADHEVFHVCRDMAGWSRRHVVELARAGRDFGVDLDPEASEDPALLASVRQRASELVGRRSTPGLLLLADLRHLYREAAGVSLDWEILAQSAQGAKERELLDLARRCHPQSLRLARWANAHLKVASPQVIVGW
ncbi:hypothetical protein SAMN06893096_102422 [Geodermatophilus pulveris]|uniref:Uncharacterized protein n=1 Tax=Geodermatophilus pulveris TaxID=1564159 RepID=A0A239CFM2_9ACTN|nr:hypothetical protein [Geodermatophilus pulveris]SNS18987.1 hypothetical protein SAMN06893096_102422 [Geodermatophilus pulveris]